MIQEANKPIFNVTVNVLKFSKLYSILFGLIFLFLCSCLLKYLVE